MLEWLRADGSTQSTFALSELSALESPPLRSTGGGHHHRGNVDRALAPAWPTATPSTSSVFSPTTAASSSTSAASSSSSSLGPADGDEDVDVDAAEAEVEVEDVTELARFDAFGYEAQSVCVFM
jgi:hypothetical protein